MTALRGLEGRIRSAFSMIKEEISTLKSSFLVQKDKNSEFDKKIGVLDGRIDNLKEDIDELENTKEIEDLKKEIKELKKNKEEVGEIHDLKKEVEKIKKELKNVNKDKKRKKEDIDELEDFIDKKDNLKTVLWVLLIALVLVVSLGLYYDWYDVFNEENGLSEDGFFRVLNVKEGEMVKLDVIAKDEDDDNLFITYTGPADSKGEWQTEAGDAGEYSITVTVSDGKETVSENVKIIVE